jgi:hypothetical protein
MQSRLLPALNGEVSGAEQIDDRVRVMFNPFDLTWNDFCLPVLRVILLLVAIFLIFLIGGYSKRGCIRSFCGFCTSGIFLNMVAVARPRARVPVLRRHAKERINGW